MAHAYTTKRGKNKLGKLGVRKDDGTRAEKRSGVASFITDDHRKFDDEKESVRQMVGHLAGEGGSSAKERLTAKTATLISDKCSSPNCPNASNSNTGPNLSACAACGSVRYCCKGKDIIYFCIILVCKYHI